VTTHQQIRRILEKREGKLVIMHGLWVKSRDIVVKTKEAEVD